MTSLNNRLTEINNLLQTKLCRNNWLITKPDSGLSKETYIAKGENNAVFVKFDVNIPPLLRLSELGLTPKVISWGKLGNDNFVIQEYIKGVSPNKEWFKKHVPQLADFIKTYHEDDKLRALLADKKGFNFSQHIKADIQELKDQIKEVNNIFYQTTIFVKSFIQFQEQSKKLPTISPVPIHGDPNYNNFLIVKNKIYFLDWDNIMLSDPLRDIGLILWWYLPKDSWKRFFNRYGIEDNEVIYERMFWWAAARSLAISLWFLLQKNNTHEAKMYLEDFYAAVNLKDNPKF